MRLPEIGDRKHLDAVLVRTDYSDTSGWPALRAALGMEGGGVWPLLVVEDPSWAGATADDVRKAARDDGNLDVVFVADRTALADPEHKVLAVEVGGAAGKLRVVPGWVMLVHGTLALTDMRFGDFVEAADGDSAGAFRGFPD
ncbi:DUF6924 domain-containing protein [Actinoplanes sp. NPDC048796]|uniref:DUF6924 domain-containing protein n=1 Tax=Actinoplanes sp. NPDC048796 TaxID=3155640 RepID=UPI0033DE5D4A